MAMHKNFQERALEAMIYLPVGTAVAARDEIPKLTSKGKAYVTTQLTMAKTVGNFVVAFRGREAERQLLRAVRRLGELWGERPMGSSSPPAAPEPPAEDSVLAVAPGGQARLEQPLPEAASNGSVRIPTSIVGYDSLSASQVVQRLAGLPRDELEAVRAYEVATRGRATIVNRTSQLLASGQE